MQFVLSKDYARAVQSFRKAAEDGNADAQFNLGVMYSKGRGVEQDCPRGTLVSESCTSKRMCRRNP